METVPINVRLMKKRSIFHNRMSRRSSGRIATMRIRETEKRQREEAQALLDYKKDSKKKAEREKKRLEKYRALGKEFEYKQMLAKAKQKRKYMTSSEDNEEDDDFKDPSQTKRKYKKKKKSKKSRGDVVNREFEKFSSGSDSNEGGPDYDSPDLAAYEDQVLDDNDIFKSDHEFSCESDVPDNEVQLVKHARTATKGGKRKRGRPKKIEMQMSEEEESEEGKFLSK